MSGELRTLKEENIDISNRFEKFKLTAAVKAREL